MRPTRRLLPGALAAALLAACGTPDNQVIGGILGNGSIPNAIFGDVQSAVHGPVTATDSAGNKIARNAVLLSTHAGFCDAIAANPDYLRTPTEAYVALLLLTPPHEVGTYYIGNTSIGAMLFTTAGVGQRVYFFPGGSGTIGLGQLASKPGGTSMGNFSLQVYDPSVQVSSLFALYGQFKTIECPALATAYVPIYP